MSSLWAKFIGSLPPALDTMLERAIPVTNITLYLQSCPGRPGISELRRTFNRHGSALTPRINTILGQFFGEPTYDFFRLLSDAYDFPFLKSVRIHCRRDEVNGQPLAGCSLNVPRLQSLVLCNCMLWCHSSQLVSLLLYFGGGELPTLRPKELLSFLNDSRKTLEFVTLDHCIQVNDHLDEFAHFTGPIFLPKLKHLNIGDKPLLINKLPSVLSMPDSTRIFLATLADGLATNACPHYNELRTLLAKTAEKGIGAKMFCLLTGASDYFIEDGPKLSKLYIDFVLEDLGVHEQNAAYGIPKSRLTLECFRDSYDDGFAGIIRQVIRDSSSVNTLVVGHGSHLASKRAVFERFTRTHQLVVLNPHSAEADELDIICSLTSNGSVLLPDLKLLILPADKPIKNKCQVGSISCARLLRQIETRLEICSALITLLISSCLPVREDAQTEEIAMEALRKLVRVGWKVTVQN
ncbi:hypothetical protein K488DRAFT_83487 [Vararia minispora EC-137]|uniref:Uncharacterized protein n=1 Tax=Vararia minispora EC-137 TaxID=1314806 RepID=A0ACB8QTZ9_9AGAM|nr:hypothetical protein K488DRAFT_83487 [Vararia minispora EC-137]